MTELKLTKKQVEFIQCEERFALYSGGVGSGKSYALCLSAIFKALLNPNTFWLLGSYTYPMLRDNILPKMKEILNLMDNNFCDLKKSDNNYEFRNGSVIRLRHLEDEGKLRGTDLNGYFIDEATVGISEDVFHQLNGRLRRGTKQYARFATNPGTKFHWLYKFFYEEQNQNARVINAKTKDNIYLPKSYTDDLLNRPKAWQLRFTQGLWGNLEGMIFDAFDHENHIIPEYDVSRLKEVFFAIDYGFHNPFALIVAGLDYDNNLVVVDEYYKNQTLLEDHIKKIKELVEIYKPTGFIADTAAPENTLKIIKETKLKYISAPFQKQVLKGIDILKARFESNQILISNKCKNLIKEISNYSWEENKEGKAMKESPKKLDDHGVDALRYLASILDNRSKAKVMGG